MHRIPLELVAVIACPHAGLLASQSGDKTSTNLAAAQNQQPAFCIALAATAFLYVAKLSRMMIVPGSSSGINTFPT